MADPNDRDRYLERYLARIGWDGPLTSTVETLRGLVTAHLAAIPFETLDPFTGQGVGHLGAEALVEKLVERPRGGFCYEQNGLLGHVLDRLGWSVERLTGRVLWGGTSPEASPRTHQLLLVREADPHGDVVVDVGFGTHTPAVPLVLAEPGVQRSAHAEHRVVPVDGGFEVHSRVRSGQEWAPLYRIGSQPQRQIDLEVGSWYASTYPGSSFAGQLVLGRVMPTTRWALGGTTLTEYPVGAGPRHHELGSPEQVRTTLRETFGVDPDQVPGLTARVDRLFAAETPS